jgi:uracil phosphoribosyltransferase
MTSVHLIKHPLVQHKLSYMRNKETCSHGFRNLLREISWLMAYEVTKELPLKNKRVETPLCKSSMPVLKEKHPVLVSILRAGNGLLDGFMDLMPRSKVGFIGLQRNEKTIEIEQYYSKYPQDIHRRQVIILDPMLATGKSAIVAIDRIKEHKPKGLGFVCLLASPEGVENFQKHHSDVDLYTAAIDKRLNSKAYIVPGLGDAGDRYFGTD